MEQITAVKGMNDLLPAELARWHFIEDLARTLFEDYGFGEVRTPVLEKTELFKRGVGEGTDIVGKEMYTFEDKGGDSTSGVMVSLRPEGTAPAVRAGIEHNLYGQEPLARWYYLGAMFRRERQQKGRYRQFFQVGAEIYGVDNPYADAELLALADTFLKRLEIGEITLELNSLGDAACRPKYVEALIGYLKGNAPALCAECQRRLETNPLRVLDCKNAGCKAIAAGAPAMEGYLCEPCATHFTTLKGLLDEVGVKYVVNPRIVRGLDYYTRTVFEFISHSQGEGGLGSQNTVCAGGRYDNLVKSLGGPSVPAIGFACGLDRLAILLEGTGRKFGTQPALFVTSIGEAARRKALVIAAALRGKGLYVEQDLRGGSVKAQMKRADRLRARFSLVLGESELASGKAQLKRMADGSSRDVTLSTLYDELQKALAEPVPAPAASPQSP